MTTAPARAAQIPIRKKPLADPVQAATPPAAATPNSPPAADMKRSPRRIRHTVSATAEANAMPIATGSPKKAFAVANATTGSVEQTIPTGPPTPSSNAWVISVEPAGDRSVR